MEKKFYIAYGSNLNVRQMKYRCPKAEVVGTARIDDYRLLYKGSLTGSFLTIEPAKRYSVPVGVWAVDKDDEKALAASKKMNFLGETEETYFCYSVTKGYMTAKLALTESELNKNFFML